MSLLKKIEYKMGLSFIKMLLARVKSKSPKFYITLRWIAGILVFCAGSILYVFTKNPAHLLDAFHFTAPTIAFVIDWSKQIGSAISAVFLFTWTGTADPALLEKPKD